MSKLMTLRNEDDVDKTLVNFGGMKGDVDEKTGCEDRENVTAELRKTTTRPLCSLAAANIAEHALSFEAHARKHSISVFLAHHMLNIGGLREHKEDGMRGSFSGILGKIRIINH
ncbi:hypothetical protein QAD02_004711 [Eretmocerus hayati]|uniref:Uncharacterized protein n=1 Tax=Eretmocerus hayati TaxID=131215 RepID=A0ACC2NQB0_9HYME|nr:hypothetical protein QAD02_004711 [Eretmocerus hayati]